MIDEYKNEENLFIVTNGSTLISLNRRAYNITTEWRNHLIKILKTETNNLYHARIARNLFSSKTRHFSLINENTHNAHAHICPYPRHANADCIAHTNDKSFEIRQALFLSPQSHCMCTDMYTGGRWDDYASTVDDTQSVTSKGTTDMMTQAQVVKTQIERMERPVPPPPPISPPQPPSPRGGSVFTNRYTMIDAFILSGCGRESECSAVEWERSSVGCSDGWIDGVIRWVN